MATLGGGGYTGWAWLHWMGVAIPLSAPFCRGDRYDAVRVCLGETLLQKLAHLRLFMVNHLSRGLYGVNHNVSLPSRWGVVPLAVRCLRTTPC